VGILALGSHEERHGAALPPDTDARLAEYVAREAAKCMGAEFLGTLKSSYELPEIDTGRHQPLEEVMNELRAALERTKCRGIKAVVLVNAHGGNEAVRDHLLTLEREIGIRVIFNNSVVELEGPHAATGELSMGAVIGITDESRLAEHIDFRQHPEVGFVGLKAARKRYPWAEQHAREVSQRGVRIDKSLGAELLERAITSVINDIRRLSSF
jgi:2-amino-5-formylamino-6-ribosylaminopyrimidin-4(3H)-one 5'-monophosphate deformylase